MKSKDKISDEKIEASKKFTEGYLLIESMYSEFEDDKMNEGYKQLANDPEHIEHEKVNKARRSLKQ